MPAPSIDYLNSRRAILPASGGTNYAVTDRRYDPQGAAEIWRYKLDSAVAQFQAREISDDVFRACLYAAGFRHNALRDEFRYQDQIRYQQTTGK